MIWVFQYGSNLSTAHLNGVDRLKGDAEVVGKALTADDFELVFDIWSVKKYAVANLRSGTGRKIWGVIYKIPKYLITREDTKAYNRKSLDQIEGEGRNYKRVEIKLRWPDGRPVDEPVITYVGLRPSSDGQTAFEYAEHILSGLKEHHMPPDYIAYVREQILASNRELAPQVDAMLRSDAL